MRNRATVTKSRSWYHSYERVSLSNIIKAIVSSYRALTTEAFIAAEARPIKSASSSESIDDSVHLQFLEVAVRAWHSDVGAGASNGATELYRMEGRLCKQLIEAMKQGGG